MRARLKPLAEQVMVITGASSGIGLLTARRAAKAGAAVVLAARNEAALREIAEEINSQGGRAHAVAGDVGKPEDVARISRAAIARFGGYDTWVNDAGVGLFADVAETSPEDHEQLFRTNYFGVVNGSLEAIKHLRGRPGGGAIINVGSVLSDMAIPKQGAYAATKHAVKAFTDALRMEMAREKAPISVTLIKPSAVNTPFAEHARNRMDAAARVPPPVYAPKVVVNAILHAAQHPTRHITVGGGGRQMVLARGLAPNAADRVLAAIAPALSRRKGPKSANDNLYEAGEDGRVQTRGVHGRGFSLYTEAQKRPGLVIGLSALALAGLAAYLGRDTLGKRARPMVAKAVRPVLVKTAMRQPLATARLVARHPKQAAKLAAALR